MIVAGALALESASSVSTSGSDFTGNESGSSGGMYVAMKICDSHL